MRGGGPAGRFYQNPAVRNLVAAFVILWLLIGMGGLALFVVGQGRWTLFEAVYMAIISVSTVGFGELHGIDRVRGARGIVVAIIVGGLATVAYFQSAMTALIVEGVIGQAWRRKRMKKAVKELSGHVVVAGIGSTGIHVVEELISTNTPFVAIDRNEAHLERISAEVMKGQMFFIVGDAIEDHTLIEAGIERASGLIAALTDDKDNLFLTLSARTLNAQLRIVSKVVEPEVVHKMLRAGANTTVSPNIIGGRRLASEMVRPEVVEFLDQMFRDKEKNLRIEELRIPLGSSYVGQPLRDVPIRQKTSVLVIAVRDANKVFQYNPGPDHLLEADSVLVMIGAQKEVALLRVMVDESMQNR